MDLLHEEDEKFPTGAECRTQVRRRRDQPALAANARSLEEEAGQRPAGAAQHLRPGRAGAAQAGQGNELAHLAEIYGAGCNRLVHLLRRERSSHSRMEKKIRALLDEALTEAQKDWPQC